MITINYVKCIYTTCEEKDKDKGTKMKGNENIQPFAMISEYRE